MTAIPRAEELIVPAISPEFEQQLKKLAESDSSAIQAGRVSVIGLDRIRARFGDAWPRLSERVDSIVRNTIRKHLLPGDVFTRFGEAGYVIVFARLDTEGARMKCLLVADEIAKALLGEDGGDLVSIGTAVAQLTGSSGIAQIMSPSCPLDHRTAAESADATARPPQLELIEEAPSRKGEAAANRITFRPMWDTANGVLSTFNIALEDDGFRTAQDEREEPDEVAARDFLLQEHALKELQSVVRNQGKVLIGLTVHFETLASASRRRQYVERLQRELSRQAASLLVIEIANVPAGVLQPRMHDLVAPLRRHCRAVCVGVPIEVADFSAFRQTGIMAVGCDISANSSAELMLIQLMSRFARAAEKLQLPAYVRGLNTVSLIAAAVGAGFRYVEGIGIGAPAAHPNGMLRFSLEDVYRGLIPSLSKAP